MKKPVLIVMAAGMGSRYGGLKQVEPVDDQGHIIMDYSIYDAKRAGFEKVIFIIKEEMKDSFIKNIGSRIEDHIEVAYVFQDINNLPQGFTVPENRVKPWGTGHAILSAKDLVDGPFVVINADDFYGQESFIKIYDYLMDQEEENSYDYAMVGYELRKTVSENGDVSRGICKLDDNHKLVEIVELKKVIKKDDKILYSLDQGQTWKELSPDTVVSMNLWGFQKSFMEELAQGFPKYLAQGIKENPEKWEFYPTMVLTDLLKENKAKVEILQTPSQWYGITYKEDKPLVIRAIKNLKNQGLYPEKLWDQKDGQA
ncbi:MAG: sugar phosphate nucleotidyltransferase [Bacillota bacterium]|nr:sugar phosphate nucleotidyltransferase [Bacillota bacterium]